MRPVRKFDDDEGVPQIDERPRGVAAKPAKQEHDQQAGRQVKQHCHNLKGRRRFREEAIDDDKDDLRGRQVGRGHLRVVDQSAARRGEIVEGGRVHAIRIRVHPGVLHVAIPQVAIHVVGERGLRGEEREAEEEGEEEDESGSVGVWALAREDEEGGEVEGEGCEVAREVIEERQAAQRPKRRHRGPQCEAGEATNCEGDYCHSVGKVSQC